VLSALWFGNGFFRSIGSPGTTRFKANLVEGDVQAKLPFLQLKTAGGYINYSDNDPLGSNHRDVYYYYVEGLHDLTQKFYLVARWSQVFANNGFPIVGNGPMGTYLFGELTSDYWRLSLGAGYAFTKNLIVKAEYSFNQGVELDGTPRDQENLVAMEAAFAF
jgi:predicted porin